MVLINMIKIDNMKMKIKYFRINFIRNGKAYYADSRDKTLFYSIHRLNHFPINFKITKYDWRIYTKNRKENIKPQI